MRFTVQHTLRNITLPQYEKLYFDEAFNDALCAHVNLGRHLLRLDTKDGVLMREVRVVPDRQLPPVAAKILGGARIEYVEHVKYTLGQYRGQWHTVSSLMSDKVKSAGSLQFNAASGGSSVIRVVEGDIEVKLFGVGSVVERFIVSDVEKSYSDAALFTQQWIDAGKHAVA